MSRRSNWRDKRMVKTGPAASAEVDNGSSSSTAVNLFGASIMSLSQHREAAERGDAQAQWKQGSSCENGWGVAKDLNEAVRWYCKSAEQGHKEGLASLLRVAQLHGSQEAFDAISKVAHAGDAEAQGHLGQCYMHGWGVGKDTSEAAKWFNKSIDQGNQNVFDLLRSKILQYKEDVLGVLATLAEQHGNRKAQTELGNFYETGWGVAKDLSEAVKWHGMAAEQGDQNSLQFILKLAKQGSEVAFGFILQLAQRDNRGATQNALAECYENGWGVTKDINEAVKWYRMAAEQGSAEAQFHLGRCYAEGNGAGKNLTEAVKWYRKSAEQANADAQYFLGQCYENGDGAMKDPREAFKWYRLAGNQGNAAGQYSLGVCYEKGTGVDKDPFQALMWFRRAAEQGHASAQHHLALFYDVGKVEYDPNEAFMWFRKAADQGNVEAQFNIAFCYLNGHGVTKDLIEAVKWYRKAAEQGNKDSLDSIFELARKGKKEAFDVLLALALQNNIEAQNMVGHCYERGDRANRNINEAIKWYRKAAEQGDKKALENAQYCIEYGSKDSFSCISPSMAAELSLKETSPLLTIESFESSVTNPSGVLLSPADKLVVIFRHGYPAITAMFDALTWNEKWRQENSVIRPQAFSPDGNFLLVCKKKLSTAAILDASTGALVRELSGHTRTVTAAAWSSSNLIATGSDDKTIRISRPDGTLVRVLTAQAVSYLSFARDGNELFSHSPRSGAVYLWDVATVTVRFVVREVLKAVKISPDGSLIAGVREGVLQFFQANDKEYVTLDKSFHEIIPITLSPDSKHLFAKNGQTLYIVHFTEEQPLCTSFHHSTDISAMAFSSDGERAVTIDNEGRVQYHLCLLGKMRCPEHQSKSPPARSPSAPFHFSSRNHRTLFKKHWIAPVS